MKVLSGDDPQVQEISADWLEFIEEVYDDFPQTATAMALGQVMMFLMQEYKPPVEEMVQVLEQVINVYSLTQEMRASGARMN